MWKAISLNLCLKWIRKKQLKRFKVDGEQSRKDEFVEERPKGSRRKLSEKQPADVPLHVDAVQNGPTVSQSNEEEEEGEEKQEEEEEEQEEGEEKQEEEEEKQEADDFDDASMSDRSSR